MSRPALTIQPDSQLEDLKAIKSRQKGRMKDGKPQKVSLDDIYQMLSDVLENQARIENKLNDLLSK